MRHLLALTCTSAVLLLEACKGEDAESAATKEQDVCEEAKRAFARLGRMEGEAALKEAPPDMHEHFRARIDEEIAKVDAVFDELCEAASDGTKACLARMDEFLDLERQRKAAVQACAKDEFELPDRKCSDGARARMEAKLGDCKDPLERFSKELFSTADRRAEEREAGSK